MDQQKSVSNSIQVLLERRKYLLLRGRRGFSSEYIKRSCLVNVLSLPHPIRMCFLSCLSSRLSSHHGESYEETLCVGGKYKDRHKYNMSVKNQTDKIMLTVQILRDTHIPCVYTFCNFCCHLSKL